MAVLWRQQLVLAALVISAVVAAALAAEATCPADEGPVNCASCNSKSGGINVVHGLPRFGGASSNLGDYEFVTCNNGECKEADTDNLSMSAPPNHPATYIFSVVAYIGFAIVMFAFSVICGCLVLCGKHCCNCFCCGRRYPTLATGKGCCVCCSKMGFGRHGSTYKYSILSQFCTRLFMLLFVFFIVVWIGMGQFNGNQGMTEAMKAVAASPQPLADLTVDLVQPVGNLVQALASDTVVGLIKGTNRTIFAEVSLSNIIDNTVCIANGVRSILDISVLMEWVGDALVTVEAFKVKLNTKDAVIDKIIYQKNNITAEIDTIDDNMADVRYWLTNQLKPNITAVQAALTDTISFKNDISAEVTAIKADVDAFAADAPTTAEKDEATTGSNSIDTVLADNMDGSTKVSERATLVTNLQTIKTSYEALPDYSATATNMGDLNSRIDTANGDRTLPAMLDALDGMNHAFTGLPNVTTVLEPPLRRLEDLVNNLAIGDVIVFMDDMKVIVDSMPAFSILRSELARIKGVRGVVDCAFALFDEIDDFNRTVISLELLGDLSSIKNMVNDTITSALAGIEGPEASIDDLEDQLDNLNFTQLRADLVAMNATARSALAGVDIDAIVQSLKDAEDKLAISDTGESSILALNTSMNNNKIDDADIAAVNTLESNKATGIADLGTIIADIAIWTKGYCTGASGSGPYTLCANDGDCGGGAGSCTNIGAVRCKTHQDTSCGPASSAGGDSTCDTNSAGDTCVVDKVRLETMKTIIANLALPALGQIGSLETSLNFDLNAVQTDFNTLSTSADSLDTQTASMSSDLASVRSNLGDFDTTTFNANADAALSVLNSLDLDSLNSTVQSLSSQLDSLNDQLSLVDDVEVMMRGLQRLLNVDMHVFLGRLSHSSLQAHRDADGLSGMLKEIAQVVDDIVKEANKTITMADFSTDLVSELSDVTDILDVLHKPKYKENGPLFFFFSLMDKMDKKDTLVQPDDPKANRVNVDTEGNAYPNDKMCLTTSCVNNEIVYINTNSLSDVTDGDIPIPLSRTNLVGLPFLIPLIIAILALAAALCICWGWCSQCMAGCVAGWVCCQLPLMFLFIGMFFPMAIVFGDVCYGAENAGYKVLQQYTCKDLGLGDQPTPLDSCNVDVSSSSFNLSFRADILGVYEGVLGQGGCPSPSPLDDVWVSMKDGVGAVGKILNDTVAELDSIKLRQPMLDVVYRTSRSVDGVMKTFVDDLSDVVTCDALHVVYAGFKESMCCDVGNSLYWMLASWYLIAWTFCLCGCTSGLLGRKRFGEPWGPEYKEHAPGRKRQVIPKKQAPEKEQVEGYDVENVDRNSHFQQQPPSYGQPAPFAATGGYDYGAQQQPAYDYGGQSQYPPAGNNANAGAYPNY